MTRSVEIPEAAYEEATDAIAAMLRSWPASASLPHHPDLSPRDVLRAFAITALEAAALPYLAPAEPLPLPRVHCTCEVGMGSYPGDHHEKGCRLNPIECDHSESLYGRCTACGMTWEQQAEQRAEPAGDGGLREALESRKATLHDWVADWPTNKEYEAWTDEIEFIERTLAAHPVAPAVPEPASEDAAFVLRPKNSAPVADWKRLDACAAASAQMIQWHAPETAAALIESAVPQPVDREALRGLFRGPNACGIWLENMLDDSEQEAITDAVLAVLAGEQEQVEK